MNTARNLKKIVGSVVVFICSLPVLLLIGLNFKSHRAANEAAKERKLLQAAQIPLTPQDLVRNPPVPDADNAAPLYVKMTQSFTAKDAQLTALEKNALKVIGFNPDLSPANMADARKLLAFTQPERDLIERAVQKPDCDFKRPYAKGADFIFPELTQMRRAVRLLVIQAALLAKEGKPLEALQCVAKGTQIVKHSGRDRFDIAMLVHVALESILDREWHRLVDRHGTSPAFLAQASKVNDSFGALPDLKAVLGGEFVLGVVTIEQIRKRQGTAVSASANSSELDELAPQFADMYEEYWLAFWRKGFAEMDKANNDPYRMRLALETVWNAEETTAKYDPLGHMMNKTLIPVMIKSGWSVVRVQAMRRMRTLKIELLRYRLAHNAFPADVKKFDTTTATDPFDSKPLHYRREGKGFRLWSIGDNLKDDNGQAKIGDKRADIVTTYP
jgi:hypothetical protein